MSRNHKLLLQIALQYPWLIALTIALGFSDAIFNGVGTFLFVPLLLSFLGQDSQLQGGPPILQQLLSVFDGIPENYRLLAIMGVILLTIILKNAAGYANELTSGHLSRSLVNSIRKQSLQLLLDIDFDFYVKTKIGEIVNRVNTEVGRTASAIRVAITMLTVIFNILGFLIILLYISWPLTLTSTVLLGLVALSNQYFINRAKKFGKLLSDNSRGYSVALQETLSGIRLVKSTANEPNEYKKIEHLITQRERADFLSQANSALIGRLNEISGIITIIAIVVLGGTFLPSTMESLSAVLLIYLVTLFKMLPFISRLNGARSQFANAAPSVELVADFLRRDNKPFMESGSKPYQGLKHGIRFENVSFAYPGHDDFVLDQVDLWVPRGTTLALVGASGAGKSTLADLLPRFYDPTKGRITIDGCDLRDFDLRSLRRAMGIVSQETFLFNDTVRNNIAYSREDVSDDRIIDAAKRSNAYEFIMNLPEGFETTIGDRGVLLSGGQRQRLAIARALLYNPEILILDEATSALDTVSERLVQQAIDELSRERTSVVIAHRLSTVQKADCIAVMDRGKVVELGSHDELLALGGHYAHLYNVQFSEETQDVIKKARRDTLIRTSYEVRSRLNPMLGFLSLLVDDDVDSPEEQRELTIEAHDAALRLLNTLQFFEDSARSSN
jgi:subfamily B ATP-binding cassette protein MsbA